ncbi:hypothetical protein [Halostella litorea]|uniref:hypothetical protein n=1 Tax=Halostella litorea TaxID=2528831 RepID=UPI00109267A1|nr:hypothetical protein [Halostella litorea]
MQRQLLTVAVAALLAFGASGVAAATTSPPTATPDGSPADVVQPSNHTVEVVDPDGDLSERDVERAWRTAWQHDAVRDWFESGPVHFQVEDVGDDLEVYVAPDEDAAPRVVADVDLDAGTVTDARPLDNVLTASDSETTELTAVNDTGDRVATFTVTNGTVVDGEAVTLRTTDSTGISVLGISVDLPGSSDAYVVNATDA